jgi:hypothetical protein
LTLAGTGLTVKARTVWTSPATTLNEYWCGAEVSDADPSESSQWRSFVDAL